MDLRKITDLLQLTTPYSEKNLVKPTNEASKESDTKTEENGLVKQVPQEELFSWKYTLPPFNLPKRILRSGFVFVFLFSIFLVLAQEWLFLLMILGLVFILNLLLKTKNQNLLTYKIYNNGFDFCGTFYSWQELTMYFYYDGAVDQLIINSKDPLPGRIYVYFNEEDKEKIDQLLNQYLFKNLIHQKDFYEYIIFKVKPYLNLSDEK